MKLIKIPTNVYYRMFYIPKYLIIKKKKQNEILQFGCKFKVKILKN